LAFCAEAREGQYEAINIERRPGRMILLLFMDKFVI
jgi:hypothetical protein